MTFNVGDSEALYYALATVNAGSTYYDFGTREQLPAVTSIPTSLGTPTGVVDTKKNEIRISFPLSLFGSDLKLTPGKTKVSPAETTSGRGAQGRGVFADDAVGGKSYVVGAASCVPVGK